MQNVVITVNNNRQWLRPNGQITKADSQEILGNWSSKSESAAAAEETNAWVLKYNDNTTTTLKAGYSFNDNNQLVVTLANEDGSPLDGHDATTLAGQIIVDDMFDLTYALIDDEGDNLGHNVYVYGTLKFLDNTNDLEVTLNGGGTLTIKAQPLFDSTLEAELHQDSAFDRSDAIVFNTYTVNQTNDGGHITKNAIIKFVGSWDFDDPDESLSFVTKVTGSVNKPQIRVAFGGKFKGVSAGFVYVNSDNQQFAVFKVRGEHKWDSSRAQWQVALGYSNNKYQALVDGELQIRPSEDTTFTLSGAFSIVKDHGHSPKFNLEMKAKYEVQNSGHIEFFANVSNTDAGLDYRLGLEGVYRFSHGKLTFSLLFDNKESNGTLSLNAALGSSSSLQVLVTNIFGDTPHIGVTLSVQLRWKINPNTGRRELVKSEVESV
ncbi:hypothetical protein D1BOALGB6SA_489 [Olavius sp. associated proteobacterium Delta 1]|nr:hypothetical protein D1BOALGB6SA_489 [Olavius sp. associated proteobacterium Delta 1]